jgi:hypothetical protein
MSLPPVEDLEKLNDIADEIRETHSSRAYLVASATALDPAFRRNRGPKSSMDRCLVIEAVERGASQSGMSFVPGRGGATELKVVSNAGYRVYRLRSATKLHTGEYMVQNNSVSAWASLDEDTLLEDEFWVLGYTMDDDGVVDIFTARVLGCTEGTPGRLILGPATALGSQSGGSGGPGGGFRPSDEGLDDLFDEDDDTAAGEASA